jgi:hypothetical protein
VDSGVRRRLARSPSAARISIEDARKRAFGDSFRDAAVTRDVIARALMHECTLRRAVIRDSQAGRPFA